MNFGKGGTMIPISHRGNLDGRIIELENNKSYIEKAIKDGYDVEIDIRFKNNSLWLGHDEPQEEISIDWLIENSNKLWIHCKDLNSIMFIRKSNLTQLNYFGHSLDSFVLTSKGFLFCLPSNDLDKNCVLVMPEFFDFIPTNNNMHGVLTDYAKYYREINNG